jgi:glycosyltransferase involved in cell wall biosynthesis
VKLLIFISSLSVGGAERVTVNLANHWALKGWEITIVTLRQQSDDFYALNHAVSRVALEMDGDSGNVIVGLIRNLRRVMALRRVLRQVRPDVALGMMDRANVLLAISSCGLHQIRAVGSERVYPPQHPLGALWERLRFHSYGHLYAVVAQTEKGAEWLKSHTKAQRVIAIPNPASWPLINQMPFINVENILGAGRKLLLAVGRLSCQKQFGLLVGCFQSLASRHADWDLVILGEGPLRSRLEVQVSEAGLRNRVFFPGRAGNIGDWYDSADLYVMSSRFEGFPNTLVEAMSYGLPVVSFDCDTGPRDIIRHKVDGLLVSSGNEQELTATLNQLMGDENLRVELANRAVDVRARFTTERIAEKWEHLFKEERAF